MCGLFFRSSDHILYSVLPSFMHHTSLLSKNRLATAIKKQFPVSNVKFVSKVP
jgi:hypothetical protein